MSVLVVGAGELGDAILGALLKHPRRPANHQVAVLVRPPAGSQASDKQKKIQDLESRGVQVEFGLLGKSAASDLVSVFRKYDTVIQAAGFGVEAGTQVAVAKAVLEAGVRRYFPWQFGMDYDAIGEGSAQDLFDEQLEVRKLLRSQQETSWTILSTGLFTSFIFRQDFGVIDLENGIVRALGSWDNTITLTGPEDIAWMVAESIYIPEPNTEGIVYIAGDTISYGRIADTMDEVDGKKFKRELWDQDFLKAHLAKDPADVMSKYRSTFAKGVGVSWPMEQTLNEQRGMSLMTFKEYARTLASQS